MSGSGPSVEYDRLSELRLVAWNIRAGGGRRVDRIVEQIARWRADVAVLCEFRGTEPSRDLARRLAALGLDHQRTSVDMTNPRVNALLVASRWPLRRIRLQIEPEVSERWLLCRIGGPASFAVGAMHVPNRVSGKKYPFHDAVLGIARRWRGGPAVLVGDTNTGCPGIDEEAPAFNRREEGWLRDLAEAGWADAFRARRGDERAYTWYSPNRGNGFRLDQAFVNRALLGRLGDARHAWGGRRGGGRDDAPSDHAALLVDLDSDRRRSDRGGVAAGMGALLLAAGAKEKRQCLPHARILIHQPVGGFEGQATDIDIHAAELLRAREGLNEILAKHTGRSLKRIQADTERDRFMSGEEAVAYGLVDGMLEQREVAPGK